MINWQDNVHKPYLISHLSEEKIDQGETFYSTLHMENGEFVRHDYKESEWDAVDKELIISWWKQTLPEKEHDERQQLLNAAVLLGIFNDLKESNSRHQQCFLYYLGLLLMRLKKLRFLDIIHDQDTDYILLQDRSDKKCYKIRDPQMTDEEEQLVANNFESIFSVSPIDG